MVVWTNMQDNNVDYYSNKSLQFVRINVDNVLNQKTSHEKGFFICSYFICSHITRKWRKTANVKIKYYNFCSRIIGTFPCFISNYIGLHMLWCKPACIFLEFILGWRIQKSNPFLLHHIFAVQNISICF